LFEGARCHAADEVKEAEDIQVRALFLQDRDGYTLEIQQFLAPGVAAVFKQREDWLPLVQQVVDGARIDSRLGGPSI
jgi:hypothetical protein